MKRLSSIVVFLFLLIIPFTGLSSVSTFYYPYRVALEPGKDTYTLYTDVVYYLDVDTSEYEWSSPDEHIDVTEKGYFSCKYSGKYRVIGKPKKSGMKKISFTVICPDFAYSSDHVDITSPDGAFHEFKLQQGGISGLDWKVSGGVFKAEMASRDNPSGPNALHLTPVNPGKGTLTYIYSSGTKVKIDVVVHESAFVSDTPAPSPMPKQTATPATKPEKDKETESAIPSPDDYSGFVLRSIYEPYNYDMAKHSPTSYKGTGVYISGTVLYYDIFDSGYGYAIVMCDSDASKMIYITLPDGCLGESGIDFGDDVEVYGSAYGIADFGLYYPLVVTTMQIVNHGEEGLYQHEYDIEETPPVETYQFARTKKGSNLRAEPSADSTKVASVKQGERLKVIKANYTDGWHQVEYRGQVCFISAKLVEIK